MSIHTHRNPTLPASIIVSKIPSFLPVIIFIYSFSWKEVKRMNKETKDTVGYVVKTIGSNLTTRAFTEECISDMTDIYNALKALYEAKKYKEGMYLVRGLFKISCGIINAPTDNAKLVIKDSYDDMPDDMLDGILSEVLDHFKSDIDEQILMHNTMYKA